MTDEGERKAGVVKFQSLRTEWRHQCRSWNLATPLWPKAIKYVCVSRKVASERVSLRADNNT